MANASRTWWTARHYLLRPDLPRKVRAKVRRYRRHAERDAVGDLAHLYRSLPAPTTIVDVGANVGLVTTALLRRFPDARVHAFEPTPETAAVLRTRLGADGRVVVNEAALDATAGTAALRVDPHTHGGGSNSLLAHSDNFATRAPVDRYRPVQVATTTLDRYADEHGLERLDVVKLDVEGAEVRVLEGATGLLGRQAIDVISSEVRFVPDYEGQPLLDDLVAHLRGAGYRLFNLYAPAESELRQALWGDATFVSDAFRAQLVAAYGEAACGWSASWP
jgi:FkbM family methyltransferase